jgi:hypothetical protein
MFLLTHHWTLNSLTPNTPYLAHFFTELRDFCSVGSAKCKAKKLINFKIKGTMCEDSTSFEFLNFGPQAYLPSSLFFFTYNVVHWFVALNVRPLGFNPFWVGGRREGKGSIGMILCVYVYRLTSFKMFTTF